MLNSRYSKRNAIVFIGQSDSGKTFFSNLLLSVLPSYCIGNFNPPTTVVTNTFWLQDLHNKDFYRSDELVIDRPDTAQSIKVLLEGNDNLKVEVKYKDAINLTRRPVVATCNGKRKSDFWQHISSEKEALNNRCYICLMNQLLVNRFGEGSLDAWAFVYEIYAAESRDSNDRRGSRFGTIMLKICRRHLSFYFKIYFSW